MSIEIRNIPLGPASEMADMLPVDAQATTNTYRYTVENILSTGAGNTNSGTDSRVEGQNSTSSGVASHAEGQSTHATADNAHAEGQLTQAVATGAHAEGSGSVASGISSHAEGYSCIASGLYSHAEGQQTTASGDASHAEGQFTQAVAIGAHAEGNQTSAQGLSSNAGGSYSTADLYAEWCRGNGTGFKYGSVAFGGSITGNTPTELFLDGSFASLRFAIPTNSAWTVKITGVAMDAAAITASNYLATLLIKNVAGTVSLVGSATVTSPNQDAALSATVLAFTADNVNKSLMCTATGIAAVTTLWMIKAEFEKVF
jgi:hypothetical protein